MTHYANSYSTERDLLREEVANITKRLSNSWQALLEPGVEEQAHAMEIQVMREAKVLIEDLYGALQRLPSGPNRTAIPEGWKLVPEKLTEPMLEGWFNTRSVAQDGSVREFQPRWKAMIDAAPIATGGST
jgi:hypothetical protein